MPYNFTGPTECMTDSDCQVYGVSGECDCGCYNNTYQPEQKNGGLCFCAAPNSCKCENNKCEGVYN